jgi:hypothetical protein
MRNFTAKGLAYLVGHSLPWVRAKFSREFGWDRRSVLASLPGSLSHSGGAWAIFVLWQPGELPWYVLNALDGLERAGVNVLAVVNNSPTAEMLQALRARVAHVLVRDNAGFDFGAYRDGSLFLAERYPTRVLYLNDSVFYLEPGLDDLLMRLKTSNAPVCAAFENYEMRYHIQSFCFSVSGEIFESPIVQGFWTGYLPVNSRIWAIHNGEMGISAVLLSVASHIDVVYTPHELAQRMAPFPLDEIQAIAADYLPTSVAFATGTTAALDKAALLSDIERRVRIRSQVHNGAFYYVRFANCPLLKRDLIYREQFKAETVRRILPPIVGSETSRLILADLERKGTGRDKRGWSRLMYATGLG